MTNLESHIVVPWSDTTCSCPEEGHRDSSFIATVGQLQLMKPPHWRSGT